MTALSASVTVPTENLLSPELVRRLCWDWIAAKRTDEDTAREIEAVLRDGGARQWQRDLTLPALTEALT